MSVVAQKGDSQLSAGNPDGSAQQTPQATRTRLLTLHARRVVVSSDSEAENGDVKQGRPTATPQAAPRRRLPLDDDIIDLTETAPGSDHECEEPQNAVPAIDSAKTKENTLQKKGKGKAGSSTTALAYEEAENIIPLFLDDDSDDDAEQDNAPDDPFALDDGSILVLNEPRSARKPIRRRLPPSSRGNTSSPFTPLQQSQTPDDNNGQDASSEDQLDEDVFEAVKPKSRATLVLESNARPARPSPGPSKRTPGAGKAPRMTKKQQQEAERERLRAYAAAFFKELNEGVFGSGIPEATELVWSKRLLTTAGRAHWKRDRHGVDTTSIQLAEKVLDCEERIRNTLSHEMCHLACWLISDAPDEQHGSIFKSWARKVMKNRSDVEVTTKHDYDINHKFNWKCEDCSKTYGRHTKSIHPEVDMCGVCKGRLVPQFTTRKRAPGTPKVKADSQNAAARSRDSPLPAMPGAFPATPAVGKEPIRETRVSLVVSDDDSDIEILAHTLKGVQITGTTGV
ncbi:uncharacterized protein TRAVEDRAFT_62357 [Trametes versicolor FP-101664 SS1]|uniref:uncharacterized protein n=1 Tax=Trametes versicolor (strain FP-101664) TaxID=717944 RepID=UPI000462313F|nr:uncharacterized protein TRAVEDRAFT_62357 [Trametes versicolor FP-101664 SS1]EIW65029.1 hypothetical protein TRAVEDRAFT_62357 [Trametes versicolor FP-101664 SS1]